MWTILKCPRRSSSTWLASHPAPSRARPSIGAYWARALATFPDLHFDHVATYVGVDSITLNFAWSGGLATEVFLFGPDRKVIRAYAHHVT